jgi:hypothetical protein
MSVRRSNTQSRGGLSRSEIKRRSAARRAAFEDPKTQSVHLIAYASRPDIQYACDEKWDEPAWRNAHNAAALDALGENIFLGDMGRLYTFEPALVTCPACRAMNASQSRL